MKKQILIIALALFIFSFRTALPQSIDSQQDMIATFLREVSLTGPGLTHFFKCYNSSLYVERFLPCCFLHLTDLLAYTQKQQDPYGYVCSVFSLFLDRIKGCAWTNSFALIKLLEDFPSFLIPLVGERIDQNHIRNEIKKIAAEQAHLLIEQNFNGFVEELSVDLFKYIQNMRAIHDVQHIVLSFLEASIGRLIWNSNDAREAWGAFKTIGESLVVLYEKNIISDLDCLNQVLWTLVYRFNYFLDLCGSSLSLEWYGEARNKLETLNFLQLEEKEKLRRDKLQALIKALRMSEAKARAYQQFGIITDTLPDKSSK